MGWTDERIDILKTLWQDGLSASQIARQLGGVTRNAVIGKVHRLGLSGRCKPSASRRASPPRPGRVRPAPPRPPPRPRPAAVDVVRSASPPELPGLVAPEGLGAHMCRWPIGDPRDAAFRFCGRDAGDATYCAPHAQVAFQPRSGRREDLARSLRRYF